MGSFETVDVEKTIDAERAQPVVAALSPEAPAALPHTLPATQVLELHRVDPLRGQTHSRAAEVLAEHGPNRLRPPKRPSSLAILLRQILNALTIVLIAAMIVSFATKDWISGGVIAFLILLNTYTGWSQEWKAEKTVAALDSVGSPMATVTRHDPSDGGAEGRAMEIPTEDVVLGDIILVKNGDVIPADARILPGYLCNLETDEALLTGESLPVSKTCDPIDKADVPIGDRTNLVYSGTIVTKGRARCVVTAVGMYTELGRIADALDSKAESDKVGWAKFLETIRTKLGIEGTSPLQIKLNKLAYWLLSFAILCAFIVIASSGFKGVNSSLGLYAVATAIGLIPASLTAVVSLTLAVASNTLAKQNALVRRMDAIETVAAVDDIVSDKTGTITVGRMVTSKVWTPWTTAEPGGKLYDVSNGNDPYNPHGGVVSASGGGPVLPGTLDPELKRFTECAALCNMATVFPGDGEDDSWQSNGDPTEVALQVFAHRLGLGKPGLTTEAKVGTAFELLVEHPFDSSSKRMSTIWKLPQVIDDTSAVAYMKGAVERVLERCTSLGVGDSKGPLDFEFTEKIMTKMDELARQGLRVLALACRPLSPEEASTAGQLKREETEKEMCFIGLVGIYDPPRAQSAGAVEFAHSAGIIPRMATGDHPATAAAIARTVGILQPHHGAGAVMTGAQFDALSSAEIDALPELPVVIARCAPETKVNLVDALHRRHRLVIMTGDGVNDSPALKRADVGFAMGKAGSDVAKGASDIILADDNFATILTAVREGRAVFINLSNFMSYMLAGNVSVPFLLLIALAIKDDDGMQIFPASTVGILYLIFATVGPPAFALGLEPAPVDSMRRSPLFFKSMFTRIYLADIFSYGWILGVLFIVDWALVLFAFGNGELGHDCNAGPYNDSCKLVYEARGTVFVALTLVWLVHALECKHLGRSLFSVGLRNNPFLLWSCVVLGATVFPIIYIPKLNTIVFKHKSISWEWAIIVINIILYLIYAETWKFVRAPLERRWSPAHLVPQKASEPDEKV